MNDAPKRTAYQNTGLIVGPTLAFATLLFFDPVPDNPLIGRMAAVVVLMASWWITEAVPLAATSFLPMVMFPLFGIQPGTVTAQSYMNSLIFLYIGGFLIALGMERWNLHRRIALSIIHAIGSRPDRIILGFMVAAAFLSMWISNTATAVMMLPIGLAIIAKMEEEFGAERSHKGSVALMIGIAYGCSIGGVATLVGTPTNLAFVKIFEEMFPNAPAITFGQWFLLGLPTSTLILFVTWALITKLLCRMDPALTLNRSVVKQELAGLGPLRYEERVVIVVGTLTALLWIFRSDLVIGSFVLPGWSSLWSGFAIVDDSTIAVLMATILFIIPAAKASDGKAILEARAFKDLPWNAILLFGGGFAMAAGFGTSGLTEYLGSQFARLGDIPLWLTLIIASVGVAALTELVSNIATVQMLVPVLAAWAVARGFNPLLLTVPATFAASMAFMMPVATPPNAVIFGSERLHIFEMAWIGLWVKIVAMAIVLVMTVLMLPLLFGVETGVLPAWAR